MGAAARSLGRLAAMLGQWEATRRHFEEALRLELALGAPHLLAHTQHDYAEALLGMGHRGDVERALQLIGSARATYERLEMRSFAAKAAALEQRARSAPSQATARSGGSRVTVLRPRS
jgi:hypothetical protein